MSLGPSTYVSGLYIIIYRLYTLPETNVAPENKPFQEESSLPSTNFQGRTVSFGEGIVY